MLLRRFRRSLRRGVGSRALARDAELLCLLHDASARLLAARDLLDMAGTALQFLLRLSKAKRGCAVLSRPAGARPAFDVVTIPAWQAIAFPASYPRALWHEVTTGSVFLLTAKSASPAARAAILPFSGYAEPVLVIPLQHDGEGFGFAALELPAAAIGSALDGPTREVVEALSERTASAAAHWLHRENFAVLHRGALLALAQASSPHHEAPLETQRIASLCDRVAARLNGAAAHRLALVTAAYLRHGGSFAHSETLQALPRPLSAAEWDEVRQVPTRGAAQLTALSLPWNVEAIVRSHHENFDGSGYPEGLAGERTPLGACILRAVEAFCAMTSPRPYRPPLTDQEAVTYLKQMRASLFHPHTVDDLLTVLASKPAG